MKNKKLKDLYLLGIGIDNNQITRQTEEALKRCRIVYHISGKHKMLKRINKNTVDLDSLYWSGGVYDDVYHQIINLIMTELKNGPGVALVTYGHPLVFDNVNHDLRKLAKRKGYSVDVFAAVSCLDTLCIDLGIEYGNGLQVIEAEDFVDNNLKINPLLETLIFQIGNFHTIHTEGDFSFSKGHFTPLEKCLKKYFPPHHKAVVTYSADNDDQPVILKTTVSGIDKLRKKIFPGTTLYVPPLGD
ncbi:MAG: hypothetical protein LH473_02475 [Chitinophagales bacterium]|nr:hypothetical protein [Chitinophagales bacterium]